MKFYTARANTEELSNILHRLALGDPTQTLPFALGQGADLLGVPRRPSNSGSAHMGMVGEPHHLQHILRALDEAIESKAALIHRQRERREPILARGNANGQAGPDFEAERIIEQAALFRRLCASRLTSIPQEHTARVSRLLKNGIDVVIAFPKIVPGPALRIG